MTIFSERQFAYAVARPSVVCLSVGNARAPYSGGCNLRIDSVDVSRN